jgi:DNA-binding transcriptional regulator WhiA
MYTFHKFGKDYSVLKKEAINHYNEGLKCKQIATLMNIDRRTVGKWLKETGIVYSKCNKADIDSNIFSNIDTEDKSYWLGFIYADGYVSKKSNFELSLGIKDLPHLEKFKEFLKYKGKIYIDNKVGRCRLHFQDEQIVNDLKSIGCVNKKSLVLTFPDISEHLNSHFIRGYFDGDGFISDPKRSIAISIVGTKGFLESIHDIVGLPKENIKHRNVRHSEEVFTNMLSGNNARKLCNYMYDNSTIYLQRKYDRTTSHLAKFNL